MWLATIISSNLQVNNEAHADRVQFSMPSAYTSNLHNVTQQDHDDNCNLWYCFTPKKQAAVVPACQCSIWLQAAALALDFSKAIRKRTAAISKWPWTVRPLAGYCGS